MRLIIGLGNPGVQYQFTRHNIGFWVIERFASQFVGSKIKWKKQFYSQMIQYRMKEQNIILSKPQTYMNLSGRAVARITDYYQIANHELLVIYDDINLTFGRIRIRKKGSAGGHRGVESIIHSLDTEEFPRLRIGIRNDEVLQYLNYPSFVLSRFLPEEEQLLDNILVRAVRAVKDIMDFGYEYAMRQYNQSDNRDGLFEKNQD